MKPVLALLLVGLVFGQSDIVYWHQTRVVHSNSLYRIASQSGYNSMSCNWFIGADYREEKTGIIYWQVEDGNQIVSLYKTGNGVTETCAIVMPDKKPIQCYGYTAAWCDETYPEGDHK